MDEEVFKAIKKFPEVKEIVLTYGEYDLMVKIEEKSIKDLDKFIFNKLRTTDGISATTTLIQAKPPILNPEDSRRRSFLQPSALANKELKCHQ